MEEDCKESLELTETKFIEFCQSHQPTDDFCPKAECREEIEFVAVDELTSPFGQELEFFDELDDSICQGNTDSGAKFPDCSKVEDALKEYKDNKNKGSNKSLIVYSSDIEKKSSSIKGKTLSKGLQYFDNYLVEEPCVVCLKRLMVRPGEQGSMCSRCSESSKTKSLVLQHLGKGQVFFSCSFCGYICIYKSILKRHLRIHAREKQFSCSSCSYTSSFKSSLMVHMRTHSGEKPFTCSHCGQGFTQKASLITHVRVHTGEKPFICGYCRTRFRNKYHLVRHERKHTGERPFACTDCTQTFAQKPQLLSHLITHTREKPHACSQCSNRYRYKSLLLRHTKTHK